MKWEYRIESFDDSKRAPQSRMNELGEVGWELVSYIVGQSPWLHNGVFKRAMALRSLMERTEQGEPNGTKDT